MRVVRIEAWQGSEKNRNRIANFQFGHGLPEKAKMQAQEELAKQGHNRFAFLGHNPNIILRVFHEQKAPPVVAG